MPNFEPLDPGLAQDFDTAQGIVQKGGPLNQVLRGISAAPSAIQGMNNSQALGQISGIPGYVPRSPQEAFMAMREKTLALQDAPVDDSFMTGPIGSKIHPNWQPGMPKPSTAMALEEAKMFNETQPKPPQANALTPEETDAIMEQWKKNPTKWSSTIMTSRGPATKMLAQMAMYANSSGQLFDPTVAITSLKGAESRATAGGSMTGNEIPNMKASMDTVDQQIAKMQEIYKRGHLTDSGITAINNALMNLQKNISLSKAEGGDDPQAQQDASEFLTALNGAASAQPTILANGKAAQESDRQSAREYFAHGITAANIAGIDKQIHAENNVRMTSLLNSALSNTNQGPVFTSQQDHVFTQHNPVGDNNKYKTPDDLKNAVANGTLTPAKAKMLRRQMAQVK